LLIIPIGLCFAVVYYALFTFAIKKFNIMTPGREPDEPESGGESVGAGAEAGAGVEEPEKVRVEQVGGAEALAVAEQMGKVESS
jgi:hypothetical protein